MPLREDLGGDAGLEERPALLDLVAHDVEQRVALDALEDLLLVIEREVGGDGARELARTLRLVDQGHGPQCTTAIRARPKPRRAAEMSNRAGGRRPGRRPSRRRPRSSRAWAQIGRAHV